jgi:hypothetical protein
MVFAVCGLITTVAAVPGQAAVSATAPASARVTGVPLTAGQRPLAFRAGTIPDTCASVRAHALELSRQGQRQVACVQPAAAAPTVTTMARGAAPAFLFDPDHPDQISVCGIGEWVADRFDMCITDPGYYIIYTVDPEDGAVIETGDMDFTFTQDISLSAVTSTFAENDEFVVASIDGDAASGTTVAFSATCGGDCSASNHFEPSPLTDGSDLTGSVAYSDSTTTVDSTSSSYTLVLNNPIAVNGPVDITWSSLTYRCDDEVSAYPGCVVPSYTPSLTTMTNLPAIAANIANIQAAGPHHYGNPNYTPAYPLHRTTNYTIINANSRVACPPKIKPGVTPSVAPTGTCDEYPFASTMEGASQTQKPDWGTALVPAAQQNSQGGYISSFYQSQRILNGDAFWVVV